MVNFCITQEFNIWMPADLDQFRRQDSDGAFIRGEGLVKLGHMAANGGSIIHQIDLEPGIAKIQAGLDSTDSSAHYHNISKMTIC